MTFEGTGALQFVDAIVDVAAIGTQTGLNIAKSYKQLEAAKLNAGSESEMLSIVLEQKRLELEAIKLLNEKAGVSEKKGKKIAKVASIAGIAGIATILAFAQ